MKQDKEQVEVPPPADEAVEEEAPPRQPTPAATTVPVAAEFTREYTECVYCQPMKDKFENIRKLIIHRSLKVEDLESQKQ